MYDTGGEVQHLLTQEGQQMSRHCVSLLITRELSGIGVGGATTRRIPQLQAQLIDKQLVGKRLILPLPDELDALLNDRTVGEYVVFRSASLCVRCLHDLEAAF